MKQMSVLRAYIPEGNQLIGKYKYKSVSEGNDDRKNIKESNGMEGRGFTFQIKVNREGCFEEVTVLSSLESGASHVASKESILQV